MPITHLLLALVVVIVWGFNFLFVKLSLEEFSPLFLCALRFLLASVPAVFFIKPPVGVPFRLIAWYGLIAFAMQFSFLFMGLYVGMTPGMTSIVMQVQIFFSLFFAIVFLGERPKVSQIAGALVSFTGIALIASNFEKSNSLLGFIFILAAAASWGIGTLITKKVKNNSGRTMFALVIWGSLVAVVPMLLLSLIFEGPQSMLYTYHHVTWVGASSLLYTVYGSTLVGYGIWNWLLSRYPVGVIVPFTLLVPIVGVLSSVLILAEPFEAWKLLAGLLVIGGLCINLLSTYIVNQRAVGAA